MGSLSRARRRALVAAVALVVATALVGCGGGGDSSAEVMDETTVPPKTTAEPPTAPPGEASTTSTASTPPGTEPAPETTLDPPVALQIPVDDELVARLPDVPGYDRDIADDDSFDPRHCDGSPVPVIPTGQAEADYRGGEGALVIGAVRFATEGEAAIYLAGFATSLVECDAGDGRGAPPEGLANLGQEALAAEVSTSGGVETILAARQGATVWYLSQEVEGGIDGLALSVVDAFQQAVGV